MEAAPLAEKGMGLYWLRFSLRASPAVTQSHYIRAVSYYELSRRLIQVADVHVYTMRWWTRVFALMKALPFMLYLHCFRSMPGVAGRSVRRYFSGLPAFGCSLAASTCWSPASPGKSG